MDAHQLVNLKMDGYALGPYQQHATRSVEMKELLKERIVTMVGKLVTWVVILPVLEV